MRLLLLEDEPSLADIISSYLKIHGFAVDVVASIHAAKAALDVGKFDIAIFDLLVSDGNALTLLKKIRQQGKLLPIVIITALDLISDRIAGLESGADDYIIKPFDLDELIARLHAVMRRYEGNPNPILQFGRYAINKVSHQVTVDNVLIELTAKEWAVLEKLVAKPGSIVTRASFEETLYGFDSDVGSNTVEVYISRIRKKLSKDMIETIRGLGYRFSGKSS
jgi:two-component system OmpR family response regulator